MKASSLLQLGLVGGLSVMSTVALALPTQQSAVQHVQFQQYADWHGHRDGFQIRIGDRWDRDGDRWDRRRHWDRDRWERHRDRDDALRAFGAVINIMEGDRVRSRWSTSCVAWMWNGDRVYGRAYSRSGPCVVHYRGRMIQKYDNWRFAR